MKFVSILAAALVATTADAFAAIKVGAKVPSIGLDKGFPPEKVDVADYTSGRKTFVVGLPGAFTPT